MNKYTQAITTISLLTVMFLAGQGVEAQKEMQALTDIYGSNEKNITLLQTFEDSDYVKWKQLIGANRKIAKAVSRSDFEEFIKARTLARAGKYENALELAKNLQQKLTVKISNL